MDAATITTEQLGYLKSMAPVIVVSMPTAKKKDAPPADPSKLLHIMYSSPLLQC